MSNNLQNLLTSYTLAPGATLNLDVDFSTEGIKKFGWEFKRVYQATAGTTGVTLKFFTAPGGPDPLAVVGVAPYNLGIPAVVGGSSVPVWPNNSTTATLTATSISSGTPVTTTDTGFLADIDHAWNDWVRFQFTNADLTNAAVITFIASIGNAR